MTSSDKIVTGSQAKFAAKIFNFGTIASLILPFPLFILWFGASMFAYAMLRHHPNPLVGEYTQRAAYYYYGLAGFLVPVLTFAPKQFFIDYWWALWIFCAAVIIPLCLREIFKANKEVWADSEVKPLKK